jgi:hypothetical protein
MTGLYTCLGHPRLPSKMRDTNRASSICHGPRRRTIQYTPSYPVITGSSAFADDDSKRSPRAARPKQTIPARGRSVARAAPGARADGNIRPRGAATLWRLPALHCRACGLASLGFAWLGFAWLGFAWRSVAVTMARCLDDDSDAGASRERACLRILHPSPPLA